MTRPSSLKNHTTTESVILLASEDTQDVPDVDFPKDRTPLLPMYDIRSTSSSSTTTKNNYLTITTALSDHEDSQEEEEADEDFSLLEVPNLIPIEIALLFNVFLSAFDGTITNSTYATIGSEFQAAHIASWITTSYMITSTSFQPLYGSFSDVLGRRACYFFATITFAIGCAGCALSKDIFTLFFFRAVTGIGGGGLFTISTIINGDLIPVSKRGLFQGFQNILFGVGLILGASLGGVLTETVGWRFCFMGQVPISLIGLIFGYIYLREENLGSSKKKSGKSFKDIDIWGSLLLIVGLSSQLAAITTSSPYLIILSIVTLIMFLKVETNEALDNPIIPFAKIRGYVTYFPLWFNFLSGFAQMGYIFILPLLFQVSLGDSPSVAGLRLTIPSTFAMIGALITAYFMNKNINSLSYLISAGLLTMALGNYLALLISPSFPQKWINFLLVPTNTGGGMANPAGLFAFIFQFPKSMQASTTSTLYLFRSIGQVWGISVVSTIIQWQLLLNLNSSLSSYPGLTGEKLQEIVYGVTRSITYVKTLPVELQELVKISYGGAIRVALRCTVGVCLIGFTLSLIHGWGKKNRN